MLLGQPEGEDLAVGEIVQQVLASDGRHVVLTGGEPMLFAELIPLSEALREAGRHVTIETAGTLYLPVACDLMSISPKLSNSAPLTATLAADFVNVGQRWQERHEASRHVPAIVHRLLAEYEHQLKFVIDTPADCEEVEEYLMEFPEPRSPPCAADAARRRPRGVECSSRMAGAALHRAWPDVLPPPANRMVRPLPRNVRRFRLQHVQCLALSGAEPLSLFGGVALGVAGTTGACPRGAKIRTVTAPAATRISPA